MRRLNHRILLFGAVLLVGSATTPLFGAQAPQPSLSSHQVQTVGEGVFPDSASYRVFGADELRRMALELRDGQNATLMWSGAVGLHFVLTQVVQAPADLTAHGLGAAQVLAAAQRSKKLAALAGPRGTDLFSIWVNTGGGGDGFVPTRASDFGPKRSFAYAPTGGALELKLHEGWHLFGCQHNPEASEPPGNSAWPTAVGFLAANGRCDAVSYCSDPAPILSGPGLHYDGVLYGDAAHDNAGQVRRAAAWVAAYNPVASLSIEAGECADAVDAACLRAMQVKVEWASATKVPLEQDAFDGFARIAASDGTEASFAVAGRTLQVTVQPRTVRIGRRQVTVTDLTLVAAAAPFVRRVIVTPPSGETKVWQIEKGESLNLVIPAAF